VRMQRFLFASRTSADGKVDLLNQPGKFQPTLVDIKILLSDEAVLQA
jgi:hypothetical protein